jgi:ABC-2 type transport system ATP-binding protein
MAENVIRIKQLTKEYRNKGKSVLANDDINMHVFRGEVAAILGPNGAGKSTLVKQIIGYLSPTAGEIELFGDKIGKDNREQLGRIGYMMQSRYEHWDHLTVRKALIYSGRLKKLSRKTILEQSDYLIKRLELLNEADKAMRTLSGGKKQAAALACTVIGFPELIILDEPTNGLDPEKRSIFWSFLKELSRDRHTTILIITHNVNEIEELADRVIIIANNKVIIDGSPKELKSSLSNQIRIELKLANHVDVEAMLGSRYSCIRAEDKKTVYLYLNETDLISCISQLFGNQSISKEIEDMKILRSTLEDIYIKLMGIRIGQID